LEALADAIRWYKESDGRVAIYDGTNSTHARRQMLLDRVKQERPDLRIKTIFIEVICNDAESTCQRSKCLFLSFANSLVM